MTASKRKLIPLGPRVVVQRRKPEEKSTGGIIIPDTAKEKINEGRVIAVGTGKRLDNGTLLPAEVKVGDDVVWGRFGGNEIQVDGDDCFSIHQDEILGVLVPDDAAAPAKPVAA